MFRVACFLLLTLSVHAQVDENPPPPLSARDEAMSRLFGGHDSRESLDAASDLARAAGLPDIVILDAQYYYAAAHPSDAMIPDLVTRLNQAAAAFKPADAVNFTAADDYRGLAEHLMALLAQVKGDEALYKTHLLNAVWLSPDNAGMFLEGLVEKRREQEVAAMKADMAKPFKQFGNDQAVTLGGLMGDSPLIVLDFWANWCQPCKDVMVDLAPRAAWLKRGGVTLMTVNVDREKQELAVGAAVKKFQAPVPWLMEGEDAALSQALAIDSIPRTVVLDRTGRVIFNGHPDDEKFLTEIRKVIPNFADQNGSVPDVPEAETSDTVPVRPEVRRAAPVN